MNCKIIILVILILLLSCSNNNYNIKPDFKNKFYDLNVAGTDSYIYIVELAYIFNNKDDAEKFFNRIEVRNKNDN